MNRKKSLFYNPEPYIPASLSEIADFFYHMIGSAPTFKDKSFPEDDINRTFLQITKAFDLVRTKLGEERYAAIMDLATRAKTLFEQDPEESNGKTMEGIKLIWAMQDIVQSVRKRRVVAKQADDEGEITGD